MLHNLKANLKCCMVVEALILSLYNATKIQLGQQKPFSIVYINPQPFFTITLILKREYQLLYARARRPR